MKRSILFLVILLITLTGCVTPAQTVEEARISLRDCTLSAPDVSPVDARCGTLTVPEDPANPEGRQIELNIAVVPAVSRDPAPDPIFLLAGGPGQAATEAFLSLIPAAERLRFKRDLVMVDQRGTGQSHPLDCPEPVEPPEIIGEELPLEEQVAELAACRAALDGDPAFYSTKVAMGDLDQVREGLGYEQVNLLGVSYGTRAALTYLSLFPDRVRSLVLDGVVPPGWVLGESTSADAQRALDLIFARCEANATCSEKFPDLAGTFDALMANLEQQPIEVTVPDPVTAEPVRVMMSPTTVGATVRLMSYSDLLAALIPLAIERASQGDYQMLASNYITVAGSLNESLGLGMYFSVICAEDAPFLPEMSTAEGYFDPQNELVRTACDTWNAGAVPAPSQKEPELKANTPVLLISGEIDPVTPPANAERVAAILTNSAHIIAPGMGHNNFYVGCIPELVLDFIEDASPESLDPACVENIRPMPFFLSPTGPQP